MNLFRRPTKSALAEPSKEDSRKQVLDAYVYDAPSPQVALDIFKGKWSSQMPVSINQYQAGSIPLFDDGRIKWFLQEIGGVSGKVILELGPLEDFRSEMSRSEGRGHRYMWHFHTSTGSENP